MDDLDSRRLAQKAANEATEQRFGKAPKMDAWAVALLAMFGAWVVALASFAIADVPPRMVGSTPDIVGVLAGAITFACLKWSERTRSKFWEERYREFTKQQAKP